MQVQQILTGKGRDVVTADPDCSVAEAARALANRRIGALVVCDDEDHVIGVFSERDLVNAIAEHGARILNGHVADIMSHDPVTCSLDDSCHDLMQLMTRHRVRHLPVLEDGRLVGIVSIGDVVKHRVDEIETEAGILRDYVMAR